MAVSFTNTSLTPGARQNADLANELEKLKIQQAIARAQSGQATGVNPDLAAKLAAQIAQQQAAAGSNQALQTQRLQTNSSDLLARLNLERKAQGDNNAAQQVIQGDRLASSERVNAAQLAAQMARQNADIQGKKDLTTLNTDEELRKRKQAATNALSLFNATPGSKLGKLNPAAAAAQLA